jgi:hypothetical protein
LQFLLLVVGKMIDCGLHGGMMPRNLARCDGSLIVRRTAFLPSATHPQQRLASALLTPSGEKCGL